MISKDRIGGLTFVCLGVLFLFTGGLFGSAAFSGAMGRGFGAASMAFEAIGLMLWFFLVCVLYGSTVSALSSRQSNRTLPLRVSTFVAWFVLGVGALVIDSLGSGFVVVNAWLCMSSAWFAFLLLVSISERSDYSVRVAGQIPERAILRLPAFLFYSGSAAGILFCAALFAATIGVYRGYATVFSSWMSFSVTRARTRFIDSKYLMILVLYLFAYALSGLLLSRVFSRKTNGNKLAASFTLLLLAVGVIIPAICSVYSDSSLMMNPQLQWALLMLPVSPFISDAMSGPCLLFSSVWAGAVFLANAPWMLRQARAFHPPHEEPSVSDVAQRDD